MSDPDHPNPNPPSPSTAPEEPELQDQVDQLLDEVEALTKETLGENEPSEARAPADVPTTDPAKEIAADDVGLSSESPLIQDGQRTSVEEVAAEVDQELDQMERLISGIEGSPSAADLGVPDQTDVAVADPAESPNPEPPTDAKNTTASADADTSDQTEVAAEDPAEAPDPEPPTDAESIAASDVDLIGSIEEQQAAPEPAVDVGSDSMPPASADIPAEDASLDEDIAELVAATLDAEPPAEPDPQIADLIPSDLEDLHDADPESAQPVESAKETSLDQDIDALLASSEESDLEATEVAAIEASIEDVSPPADLEDPPAPVEDTAPKPEAAPRADIDLESVLIWRVVKFKLKARTRHLAILGRRKAIDALVWLLERLDAKIGKKLSPMARELVGYCALATLAMSIIALIIFLI